MSEGSIPIVQSSTIDSFVYRKPQNIITQKTSKDLVLKHLSENTLLPNQQKSVLNFWCKNPPKSSLHKILIDQNPTSAQVLALKAISCKPETSDLSVLWKVFFESRFGIQPEDPDIFSRALRIIIEIEKKQPNGNLEVFTEVVPDLMKKSVF